MNKYGPFINIIAIALALVAAFSTLLNKMLGKMDRWAWLSDNPPTFLITAGPRIIAVAFMALAYVTINRSNYLLFAIAAVLIAAFAFWSIVRFDFLRKLYIVQIPLLREDGQISRDPKGNPRLRNVVIGPEEEMKEDVKEVFFEARKNHKGLDVINFMSGFAPGGRVNDPAVIWPREILIEISNKLSVLLMFIALSAVLVLYIAAFVIEVNQ